MSRLQFQSPRIARNNATLRKQRENRKLRLEFLEARSLLAGDVAGTIYDDINNNGAKDGGDGVLPGWTVYADLDHNGSLTAGEPSAITNIDGDYLLTGVPAGVQNIREMIPAGWVPSAGTSDNRDAVVLNGKEAKLTDFFNYRSHVGTLLGTVWQDLNADGTRATDIGGAYTDPGVSGWTVFLDENNNLALDGGEPTAITDANGQFAFRGIPAGEYELIEILPSGWDVSPTYDIKQTVVVIDGAETTVRGFGNVSNLDGSVQGIVWNDLNGDGLRATDSLTGEFTDPGLADWTVFLDFNRNGAADAGEPTTLTDAGGTYLFTGLLTGDYEVTEVLPDGWSIAPTFDIHQTAAVTGGALTNGPDFGNIGTSNGSIVGAVWNDVDGDGVRASDPVTGAFTEPGLADWTIFIDLNHNNTLDSLEPTAITDALGRYQFLDLQVGEYELREVLPGGWETAPTFDDNYPVRVYGATESVAPDFANVKLEAPLPASVSGVIWEDLNGDGTRAVDDPALSGWVVFVDANANGALDSGERQATSDRSGIYQLTGLTSGTVNIQEVMPIGWHATSPFSGLRSITIRSGQDTFDQDFGNARITDAAIRGTVFNDADKNGVRSAGERGLAGITVYLDANDNGILDAGELHTTTSEDQFYTPAVDEAGNFSFTHLASGGHVVRVILPATLSATPADQITHSVTLAAGEERSGVDTAAVYRPSEIHGTRFNDSNGNHVQDAGETGFGGTTVYVDLDRDNTLDPGEPTSVTGTDGSYSFTGLAHGFYVVRDVEDAAHRLTYPLTTDGILWPAGVSNSAVGNVTPSSLEASLTAGQSLRQTVSLTLPTGGALTNMVDVFLLFDDTGSFVYNSPIVRAAFPTIMSELQTSLPGINLGFGVGRLEEYANFAYEFDTGRPFVLNQPIVAAGTAGYQTAIQAALDRETPGYGGDQPETDIEALYQLVTGRGFDGNNNGSVLDSGPAGLAATQLNPGSSGDVPSFASFTADPAASVLPAAGNVGGAGFRAGALPIVLLATDTGFAYQPKGETSITGVGGLSLPISSFTETSRPSTPFNYGAGIQETVTGLNALGALVIGLGTNAESTLDPRQGLEALSSLTGAVNRSTTTIDNGTFDPIAPGDPMYFQIAGGFGGTVAGGVVNAIQNAVTNVAVNVDVRASDPHVRIVNHTGVQNGVGAGQTATFDIEIIGDGVPRRFDLQFVRAGTNVVLGSIPVVIGTPISGNGYDYTELDDGEIETELHFGAQSVGSSVNVAPGFTKGADVVVLEDAGIQSIAAWATDISPGPAGEAGQVVDFRTTVDNAAMFSVLPSVAADGTLSFAAAANAFGTAVVTVVAHDNGGVDGGGSDTGAPQTFTITVTPVNDAPVAVDDAFSTNEDTALSIGIFGLTANDSDIDGNALSAVLVSGPRHGVLARQSDGSFTYSPVANYFGTDSFTYTANDGSADSNVAVVNIVVAAINDTPVASEDVYSATEDTSLTVPAAGVLANDVDVDGDRLSAVLVSGPSHGALTLNPDGSFEYLPAANYFGADSFSYRANDGSADSNVAVVNITVLAVNDAPVAIGETYAAVEDVSFAVAAAGVLINDTDVEGDALTAVLVTGPSHGSVTFNADGSFRYTPVANFNGSDAFTYRTTDGAATSNVATVAIVVAPVNDAPVAAGESYSVNQNAVLTVPAAGVLANDSDVDRDSLTATLVAGPTHGTLALTADGGFVYTPAAGFSGADGFTYIARDALATSNVATVAIQVNPSVPAGTKFYVVDGSSRSTFGYDVAGKSTTNTNLNKENSKPRGIASNREGTLQWTIDQKGDVFIYNAGGKLMGSWTAKGLCKPEGITTDGVNLWVVDDDSNRVFYFAGGAARRSGSAAATSSFALTAANRDPMDLVTDGTSVWVVNDTAAKDSVFRYSVGGVLQGSWRIDATNATPTGITIDPNNVNHIWIVDARTDRVYQYDGAATRLAGNQSAGASFQLATADRDPQGIADPLPPENSATAAAIDRVHADHSHHDFSTTRHSDEYSAAFDLTTQDRNTRERVDEAAIDDFFTAFGGRAMPRRHR